MTDAPAVHTRGLTKRFGRRTAVDSLDLEIARGSVFGYLGPNGAGKTTTIKLLVGLYRPSAGTATVLGADIVRERDRVQARVGYLPGDFRGYPDMTGQQLLTLLGGLRGGVDASHVQDLADRLGIDLGRRLGTLSHGNRQKVGIIQAFMHRPELVVLDEPTTGLDPLVQREFLTLLRETRDSGATVLLSSHVLSEVAAVADTVGIIDEGQLLTVRTMAQLHAEADRLVDLRFDDPVPEAQLSRAAGVVQLTTSGRTAHVRVRGSTADLLRTAAPYGVVDVHTHEADLAEMFLRYYPDKADHERSEHRLREDPVGAAPLHAHLG